MRKDEADQLVGQLQDLFTQTTKSIQTSQQRDSDKIRKDLDDIQERLNALERQRSNFNKYINDMSKALKETMTDTIGVIIAFETDRKEQLAQLLEEVTGEPYTGQKAQVINLRDEA